MKALSLRRMDEFPATDGGKSRSGFIQLVSGHSVPFQPIQFKERR